MIFATKRAVKVFNIKELLEDLITFVFVIGYLRFTLQKEQ